MAGPVMLFKGRSGAACVFTEIARFCSSPAARRLCFDLPPASCAGQCSRNGRAHDRRRRRGALRRKRERRAHSSGMQHNVNGCPVRISVHCPLVDGEICIGIPSTSVVIPRLCNSCRRLRARAIVDVFFDKAGTKGTLRDRHPRDWRPQWQSNVEPSQEPCLRLWSGLAQPGRPLGCWVAALQKQHSAAVPCRRP